MSTFVRFNSGDIVLSTEKINSNLFSGGINEMTTFHTSSTNAGYVLNDFPHPSSSGQFFHEVFQSVPVSTSSVEFTIGYGHKAGSGSPDFNDGVGGEGKSASRTIYSQYRQLVFGDENQDFTFNGTTPDDIYVINFERARIKQGLKPGSLNLTLSASLPMDFDPVYDTGGALEDEDIFQKHMIRWAIFH